MKLFKIVMDGLLSIADSTVEQRTYNYPKTGGFDRDMQRIAGDMRSVGGDMRKAINKHGSKQSHKSSGA